MKIVGLVTEYNPFHNGHKYHVEEAKRITGADLCIAVMSGNFMQRGTPAIIDKYVRTEMALKNGIDLVLELPVSCATSSAEYFAHGAIALLDGLGIVDAVCFGSECGQIEPLDACAKFLINPPKEFDDILKDYIKSGLSFPAARVKAIEETLSPDLVPILSEPNNILGIEYIKALHRLHSNIKPVTIQRKAAHYHEGSLNTSSTNGVKISSATALRNAIHNPSDSQELNALSDNVPSSVYELLSKHWKQTYPILEQDFYPLLHYKLLYQDQMELSRYADVSSDFADRLKNLSTTDFMITDLAKNLKTKNLTLTRINRAFIHIILNLYEKDLKIYRKHDFAEYGRVLGFKKESSHLLRKISEHGKIPMITKVSQAPSRLSPLGLKMLEEDIAATHLYNQIIYYKYGSKLPSEYQRGVVILSGGID